MVMASFNWNYAFLITNCLCLCEPFNTLVLLLWHHWWVACCAIWECSLFFSPSFLQCIDWCNPLSFAKCMMEYFHHNHRFWCLLQRICTSSWFDSSKLSCLPMHSATWEVFSPSRSSSSPSPSSASEMLSSTISAYAPQCTCLLHMSNSSHLLDNGLVFSRSADHI